MTKRGKSFKRNHRKRKGAALPLLFNPCDVVDPFAAVNAPNADGCLDGGLDHQAQAENGVGHLENDAEQVHHRQRGTPERNVVDHERGTHIAAAAQHAHDHRG